MHLPNAHPHPGPARPLTAEQRDQLGGLLSAQLAARRAQVAARQGEQSFVDHAVTERAQDHIDVMQRDGEREVDGMLSERDRVEVSNLSSALGRIDAGTYGMCIDCGVPIGFERLLAQPDAARCSACETLHEALSHTLPLVDR
jgi:RNA polymerase-binding transcription factor DksA